VNFYGVALGPHKIVRRLVLDFDARADQAKLWPHIAREALENNGENSVLSGYEATENALLPLGNFAAPSEPSASERRLRVAHGASRG
jgi:hypothetical protein